MKTEDFLCGSVELPGGKFRQTQKIHFKTNNPSY